MAVLFLSEFYLFFIFTFPKSVKISYGVVEKKEFIMLSASKGRTARIIDRCAIAAFVIALFATCVKFGCFMFERIPFWSPWYLWVPIAILFGFSGWHIWGKSYKGANTDDRY